MSQFNLNMTPALEKAIAELMALRGVKTKSEVIRLAVQEALENSRKKANAADFATFRGLARQLPENPTPRFQDDDELWR